MKKMQKEERHRVIFASIAFSAAVAASVIYVFKKNLKNLTLNCSFLDPIIVDVFALLGGAFLIIEGMWSIVKLPASDSRQNFRVIRVLFGVAVFTIHVMQIKYG